MYSSRPSRDESMKQITNRIVERINREIGADIKNLNRSKNIINDYTNRVESIEAELLTENNNVPSMVKSTLVKCRDAHETLSLETEKIENFQQNLDSKLINYRNILDGASVNLNKIQSLQCLVEYFKIIKDIQEVSKSLTISIKGKDDQKTIGLYLSLYGGSGSANSIIGRLEDVEANNLKTYADGTARYWYSIIKDKFSK